MKISLAPLQGLTEFTFRNAIAKTIGGIDSFYTPYLRYQNDGTIKKKHLTDILPENNKDVNIIPQILVNNSTHFIQLAKMLADYGYSEINWNLGCPYPMVTNRKLGSGLLAYADEINKIIDESIHKITIPISVKLRLGYNNSEDYIPIINILNNYPIKEVTLHPRYGKQLYKGQVNLDAFKIFTAINKNPSIYNGDIIDMDSFKHISNEIKPVNHFMIGRGLISNPFLAQQIKGTEYTAKQQSNLFLEFHSHVWEHFSKTLSGDAHLLNKMLSLWEYFGNLFIDHKKELKKLKKTKSAQTFLQIANDIILSY